MQLCAKQSVAHLVGHRSSDRQQHRSGLSAQGRQEHRPDLIFRAAADHLLGQWQRRSN